MSQITYSAQRPVTRGVAPTPLAPALIAQQKTALQSLAATEIVSARDDLTDLIGKLRVSGLKVEREDVDEPFELSVEQRSSVYKIVQESLVNVLLHGARGEKTVVLFEWSDTALALTIASALRKDPISYGTGEAFEGDGIPLMRKCTHLLGGEFNAHAGYGRWVVSVDFPRSITAATTVSSSTVSSSTVSSSTVSASTVSVSTVHSELA